MTFLKIVIYIHSISKQIWIQRYVPFISTIYVLNLQDTGEHHSTNVLLWNS